MAMKRARYSRELYYTNIRQFMYERVLTNRALPLSFVDGVFIPLVPSIDFDVKRKEGADEILMNVRDEDALVFEKILFERWDAVFQQANYSTDSLEKIFHRFLLAEYYTLLDEAIKNVITRSHRNILSATTRYRQISSPHDEKMSDPLIAMILLR